MGGHHLTRQLLPAAVDHKKKNNKQTKMSCAPPFVKSRLNNKTKAFRTKMNGQNVSTESLPGFFETILTSPDGKPEQNSGTLSLAPGENGNYQLKKQRSLLSFFKGK